MVAEELTASGSRFEIDSRKVKARGMESY